MSVRIPGKYRAIDEKTEPKESAWRYTPTFSEGFGAQVSTGFRMTTTRMAMEEADIYAAEKSAYGVDVMQDEYSLYGLVQDERQKDPRMANALMPEEDWKNSEYYNENIKWNDKFTEQRARILYENYNERRHIDEVIARRQRVAGGAELATGFLANMVGNLPDPVNLVSFMPGGAKTLMGRMFVGAGEGLLGTALADAIVMPDLRNKGENVTWLDAVNDMMAGAVLGSGFGALGHGARKLYDSYHGKIGSEAREVAARALVEDIPSMHEDILSQMQAPRWMGEPAKPSFHNKRVEVSGVIASVETHVRNLSEEMGRASGEKVQHIMEVKLPQIREQIEAKFEKEIRSEAVAYVDAAVDSEPIYQAIRYARSKSSDLRFDRQQVIDLIGREGLKEIESKHPGIFKKNGQPLDNVTEFGFINVDDFLNALSDAEPIGTMKGRARAEYIEGAMKEVADDVDAMALERFGPELDKAVALDAGVLSIKNRLNALLEGKIPRNATPNDFLLAKHAERMGLDDKTRKELMLLLEKAVNDIQFGKDVSIGSLIEETGFYKKMSSEQRQSLDLREPTPEEVVVPEEIIAEYDSRMSDGAEDIEVEKLLDEGKITGEDLVEYDKAKEQIAKNEDSLESALEVLECTIGIE